MKAELELAREKRSTSSVGLVRYFYHHLYMLAGPFRHGL
jgi:hypothetical protein